MRPFHPSMFPHVATFEALQEREDATGSIVQSWPVVGASLPCRVRLTGPREMIAGMAPVADTLAKLAFPADPGAVAGDVLVSRGFRYRALARAEPRDGDGALFVLACQLVQ
jgi:hypothetical protein